MRVLPHIALVLTLCAASGSAVEFEEAPHQVELRIGSSTHLIVEGVRTTIRINGRSTPVQVVRRPSQTITIDDFAFNAPNHFRLLNSSNNRDPESASWMLQGKSAQLTIHRKGRDTSLAFLVDHMAKFYRELSGISDLKQKNVVFVTNGATSRGVRFLMNARGEGLTYQDYFQLPIPSGKYHYFLVVHAKPGDSEAEQARDLLGNSLRF